MARWPPARGFQGFQSWSTFRCPHPPPQMLACAMWGLQIWIAGGGDCRRFYQPLHKTRARFVVTSATIVARWARLICAFRGRSSTNYTIGQSGRGIYTATFATYEGTAKRRCCGDIFVGEALRWVHWRRSYVAITAPEKARLLLGYHVSSSDRCTLFFIPFLPQLPCNFSLLMQNWGQCFKSNFFSIYLLG